MKFIVYLTETEATSQVFQYEVEAESESEAVKIVDSGETTDENFRSVRIVREELVREFDVSESPERIPISFD